MKTRFSPKREFPCGQTKFGALKDHLQHYSTCQDEACQKRAVSWQVTISKINGDQEQAS